MASIRKEVALDAPADRVWDAVRDVGALHTRLVPGFVVDTQLEDGARIVTFADGVVTREVIVGIDDESRRLAYAIPPEGRIAHYAASVEVHAVGEAARLIWTIDLLPDALAPYIDGRMEQGIEAMQRAFRSG
jgi:hypothetical protein